MAKKIRYVPLDWSSAPDPGPFSSLSNRRTAISEATDCAVPHQLKDRETTKRIGVGTSESHTAGTTPSDCITSSPMDLSIKANKPASQVTPSAWKTLASNGPDKMEEALQRLKVQLQLLHSAVKAPSVCEHALSRMSSLSASPTTSSFIPISTTHAAVVEMKDDNEKLSLTSHRRIERPPVFRYGTSKGTSLPRFPITKPNTPLLSMSSSPATDLPLFKLETRSSSNTTQAVVPQWTESIFPRKPAQSAPTTGKVYFMPDGRHFPDSVIHYQKRHSGFFQHPVLVVDTDGDFVYFYAMTKEPPKAIRDLDMALRMGATREDDGLSVLRLAPDSDIMLQATWVNLEQQFFIEWRNLDEWAVDVRVHPNNFYKISRRVFQLEADQNRFIYKPLLRDMSTIQPGTIIMLPNAPNISTLGAPVLVVENTYPSFRFLRVKRFTDNINFNALAKRKKGNSRTMSLGISTYPSIGHDGTPILFVEPDSPEMQEYSYVEIDLPFKYGELDQCRTWCWPPVKINMASMAVLHNYIANVTVRETQDARNGMAYHHEAAQMYPRVPAYYTSPTNYEYGIYSTMPPSGYYTYQIHTVPAYSLGSYMAYSDAPPQPCAGADSGQNT